jgi:hypothetical protein
MVAVAGDTAIELSVGAETATAAFPLMPLTVAVIVVEPLATAVASPVEATFATAIFEDVQAAVAVTSAVEPSLYVALAANCCVAPATMVAVAGDTVMAVSVFCAAATVRVALPVSPPIAAVTVVEPEATAVAMPDFVIVATFPSPSLQVAAVVTSEVEPSL